MARSQNTNSDYVPVKTLYTAPNEYVRTANGATNTLAGLVLNSNTNWAQRSPNMIAHPSITDHTGTAWSSYIHGYQLTIGSDSRNDMRFALFAEVDAGGVTGTIEIGSVNGPTTANVSVVATSYAWVTGTVQFSPDGNENDIFRIRMKTDTAAKDIRLRSVCAWIEPHAGALPTGVETSGFTAHDTGEVDADSPLHVPFMRREAANIVKACSGDTGWLYPFVGWSQNLGLSSKAGNYFTINSDWTQLGGVFLWPRQFLKSSLSYHIFGTYAAAGTGGTVRIRNLDTEDATEHALPSDAGVITTMVGVTGNWKTGTIAVNPLPYNWHPKSSYFDRIVLEAKSTDGVNEATIWGVCIQETAGLGL